MIDVIENDIVERVDLQNILQTLSDWQNRLGESRKDWLTSYILEDVVDIIMDNTTIWRYE